jgi:hypothetical protein
MNARTQNFTLSKILYPTVMSLQASLQENITNIADNEAHRLV